MTFKRRKKSVRFRGSKTHGYGSMKKHRGGGHRGGRGNAGTGKRADSKKPSFWKIYKSGKDPSKTGFTMPRLVIPVTMNVNHLSSIADRLVLERKAVVTQGAIVINLRELGIDKLLGSGKVARKLKVTVPRASPGAKEKIEAAGGTLDAEIVDKESVLAKRKQNATEGRAKRIKPPIQQEAKVKAPKAEAE
jgi:large subunit ribosomal protein L15